ncbi:MAG: hypothetical protein RL477_1663 [Pseudomonadota bacterium]|jgi:4-hydroxy-3-polyprenylbenzoate decarboxylase
MSASDGQDRKAEALGDLRAFLRIAEEAGEVERVTGADPELEMGALYELSLERAQPPVLLFENMVGAAANHRIAVNVRSARVVGGNTGGLDLVEAYRAKARKTSAPIPPAVVKSGPILENVMSGNEVNARAFPMPRWHADDGGAYIGTECVVITRDPDSGWVNLGTYRTMLVDERTVTVMMEPGKHGDAIRRKYWARGLACPMAICLGQAPVLGAVAASTLPAGLSEYDAAGGRIGRPIEVIEGLATGLPIPADGEIVLEGRMPPPDEASAPEGPFGEWPGYYASGTRPEAVLRIEKIYHRNDPIMTAQPPARPTLPGTYFGTAGTSLFRAATLWDEIEAAGVPGVKGVWKMPGGGSRFINVVAICQMHAGHAKMAGLVATGAISAAFAGRVTIVVDDDIDITNAAEVMWALATRWDPKTQTDIIDGCWSGNIDPRIEPAKREAQDFTNSRIIIYAVRPWAWKDEFPKVNAVSPEYAAEVRRKWAGKLPFLSEKTR